MIFFQTSSKTSKRHSRFNSGQKFLNELSIWHNFFVVDTFDFDQVIQKDINSVGKHQIVKQKSYAILNARFQTYDRY
jgi:hypothetical protein